VHGNRNLFLFFIEINNMHAQDTFHPFYQYPGPVFGAGANGAADAVFRDIVSRVCLKTAFYTFLYLRKLPVIPHFSPAVYFPNTYGFSKYVYRDTIGQTWPRVAIVRFWTFPKVWPLLETSVFNLRVCVLAISRFLPVGTPAIPLFRFLPTPVACVPA